MWYVFVCFYNFIVFQVVCEFCCKEFIGSIGKVKFALKEHIQAIHMGIRKACDECGKTFISNIVLNKHKKHVHRKEGSYPCKACGKVFRYSQQAIDHEYKDRGLAPYTCNLCPFKSPDNWALAKHKKVCTAALQTETPEPVIKGKVVQFECNLCGLTFYCKKELDGHLRLDHDQ